MSGEWTTLQLSLGVAVLATLGCAPFAVVIGTILARWKHPARIALEAVVMAPLVLPPVVTGWGLLVLFAPNGILGAPLLHLLGVRLPFSTAGVVLAAGVVAFPLFVRAVRLSVSAVDPALEDAARSLGASPWQIWRRVTMPLAMSGVWTGALLCFARALGEFGATITFAGNMHGETRTIPLAIFRYTQIPGHEGEAMRLVLLSLTVALGALVASEWMARRES